MRERLARLAGAPADVSMAEGLVDAIGARLARPARRDGAAGRGGPERGAGARPPDARLRALLRREPAERAARGAGARRSTTRSRARSRRISSATSRWRRCSPTRWRRCVHLAARGFGARGRLSRGAGGALLVAAAGRRRSRSALALVGVAAEVAAPAAVAAGSTGSAMPALAFWLWLFAASLAEAEGFAAHRPGRGGASPRASPAVAGPGRRSGRRRGVTDGRTRDGCGASSSSTA